MLRSVLLFHFLSSLLDLSLGATTVVQWSLPNDLQPYEQISVFAGDSIQFEYPGENINVVRTGGSCDSTDSELIGAAGEGTASYTFTEDQIDTVVTFAADYWNFCGFGMIINVLVLAPLPSEVPSDAPSLVPTGAFVPAEPASVVPTALAASDSPTAPSVPSVASGAPTTLVPAVSTSVAPSQVDRADDPPLLDTITVGDETALDWSLPSDLQPLGQITMFAGETLRFEYPGTSINVMRNPSGSCDGNGSELIGVAGVGSATYTFDDSQIDSVVTFSTDYWNFCSLGLIINVLVLEPPPSSAPSLSPSAAISEAPTVFPTPSPTEPVPTNLPTALANLVVEEAVVDWSLPDNSEPFDQISVYARGTIRFQYPGTNINVLRVPSGTCGDTTGSELVGAPGEGNAAYTFTEDQIDTVVTFATDYWNFCNVGMIIGVLVLEPPPSAAPSESPSGTPSLSPVAITDIPSIAPSPSSPVDQPTMMPTTDAPFSDPTETEEPTIAKKTRPPTATEQPAADGDRGTAASAAASMLKSLCVILLPFALVLVI
ncbi:unnamed protein product [Cylindrotheca closterium]|uniref:Phytocyanin domain-containing protein n=1 Tax=Cylindrotheca closterium TaxID=2856 RepID=A0AAD2CHM0_9STRA|nr:unnamed protein product [Cylindrotheca closterium]